MQESANPPANRHGLHSCCNHLYCRTTRRTTHQAYDNQQPLYVYCIMRAIYCCALVSNESHVFEWVNKTAAPLPVLRRAISSSC